MLDVIKDSASIVDVVTVFWRLLNQNNPPQQFIAKTGRTKNRLIINLFKTLKGWLLLNFSDIHATNITALYDRDGE